MKTTNLVPYGQQHEGMQKQKISVTTSTSVSSMEVSEIAEAAGGAIIVQGQVDTEAAVLSSKLGVVPQSNGGQSVWPAHA